MSCPYEVRYRDSFGYYITKIGFATNIYESKILAISDIPASFVPMLRYKESIALELAYFSTIYNAVNTVKALIILEGAAS